MSSSIAWGHNDVTICVVVKQDAGSGRVKLSTFLNEKKKKKKKKKTRSFQIYNWGTACLQINPIKFHNECWNRNTVKISFCKVALPLVKFSIKDVKMTKKRQNKWLPYPYLAPYNTREED